MHGECRADSFEGPAVVKGFLSKHSLGMSHVPHCCPRSDKPDDVPLVGLVGIVQCLEDFNFFPACGSTTLPTNNS